MELKPAGFRALESLDRPSARLLMRCGELRGGVKTGFTEPKDMGSAEVKALGCREGERSRGQGPTALLWVDEGTEGRGSGEGTKGRWGEG